MLVRRPRFKQPRCGRKRNKGASNYEKMMKTLLLQNQQLIIQQSNVMFIMMKQLSQTNHSASPLVTSSTSGPQLATANSTTVVSTPLVLGSVGGSEANMQQSQQLHGHHHHSQQQQQQQQQQQHQHINHQQHQQQSRGSQQQQVLQNSNQLQSQQLTANQYHQLVSDVSAIHSNDMFCGSSSQQQSQVHEHHMEAASMQQVAAQMQENLSNYLTPAASEQDPISDKTEDDDLAALLDGNGLLPNNLLYNPQTDIGSVTPYKSQQQQQTPSYYSSGCESLTTPRVEQQKHAPTINVSQNVVKNLADSFKSPSKPKINVQIMSGSATGSMKNSKAKIIQRMNISEFLRHVHPETGESKNST